MFLVFGLVMEFPILLVGLSRVGIVTSERLASSRRMVILGIAIFSAVATPGGDLVSPFVLGGTMYLLYEPRSSSSGAAVGDRRGRPAGDAGRGRPNPPSSSSAGCPVAARRPRPSCSRTSATPSSTTCPASCCPTWPSSCRRDRQRFARVAIVLDVRAGDATLALAAMRGALEGRGIRPRVVFLEASDDVLIRRFSETRHRHPLGDERGIANSIAEERRRLEPVRAEADVVLDTSELSLRQLRERLFAQLATDVRPDQLAFQLISFGFKHGVPLEADLVFDVRFMQNPYYVAGPAAAVGPDRRGPGVRARPAGARRASSSSSRSSSTFADPGLHRRGQDAADDRHRLHRRLPPLDRHRRGGRDVAARARTSGPVAVFHRELDRT